MKTKKAVLIGLELLLLIATSCMFYFLLGSSVLLEFIELHIYQIMPHWIMILLILAINVIWIFTIIRFSLFKNIYIKILLVGLLLIPSVYIVYGLLLLNAYSGMR